MNNDLDEEIEQLAISIEEAIEQNEEILHDFPEFEPRSSRSRKAGRAFEV